MKARVIISDEVRFRVFAMVTAGKSNKELMEATSLSAPSVDRFRRVITDLTKKDFESLKKAAATYGTTIKKNVEFYADFLGIEVPKEIFDEMEKSHDEARARAKAKCSENPTAGCSAGYSTHLPTCQKELESCLFKTMGQFYKTDVSKALDIIETVMNCVYSTDFDYDISDAMQSLKAFAKNSPTGGDAAVDRLSVIALTRKEANARARDVAQAGVIVEDPNEKPFRQLPALPAVLESQSIDVSQILDELKKIEVAIAETPTHSDNADNAHDICNAIMFMQKAIVDAINLNFDVLNHTVTECSESIKTVIRKSCR